SFVDLMRQAGFRPVAEPAEDAPNWTFKGRPRPRPEGERRGHRSDPRRADGARGEPGGRGRGKPERERAADGRAASGKAGQDRSGPPRERRPDRENRGRERDDARPRQIVATGKALAG